MEYYGTTASSRRADARRRHHHGQPTYPGRSSPERGFGSRAPPPSPRAPRPGAGAQPRGLRGLEPADSFAKRYRDQLRPGKSRAGPSFAPLGFDDQPDIPVIGIVSPARRRRASTSRLRLKSRLGRAKLVIQGVGARSCRGSSPSSPRRTQVVYFHPDFRRVLGAQDLRRLGIFLMRRGSSLAASGR